MNYLYSTMMYINVLYVDPDESAMDVHGRPAFKGVHGWRAWIHRSGRQTQVWRFRSLSMQFCKNEKDYSSSRTIHSHLFNSGFMPNYYIWIKHGERGIVLDNNVEEEDKIPDFAANYNAFFNNTAMGEPEEGTEGYVVEDDLGQKRNREIWSLCWRTTEHCCTLIANKTKEVGYHIGIIAMEGIKWFVWQGIRGVAETYKKLTLWG